MMRRVSSTGSEPGTNNSGANDLSREDIPTNVMFSNSSTLSVGVTAQVFQINCHKSINSNLSLAFHSQNFDHFCYSVQEPYCTKTGHFLHISGGNRSIISTDPSNMPRAIVVHSKSLPIIPLQQFCTRDLAVGQITFKQRGMAAWQTKTLIIISSYWDINVNDIPEDLQAIVRYAKSKNFPFQVHMDSNCHSTLFGSRDQNERGTMLEDYMALQGLVPGNVGNENTFIRGDSGTLIDVTFGTPDAISQISNWRVHRSNILDSDHRLIQMEIAFGRSVHEYSRDLTRVNWDLFRHKIKERVDGVNLNKSFTILELESTTNKLEKEVLTVLDELAPVRKRFIKERFRWWTKELQALWDRREDIKKMGNPTPDKRTLLNKLTKDFNKLKRFEKRKAKRTFLSESNTPLLMAKMNKILNSQPRNQIGILRKEDGSFTESLDESLDLILGKCFPGCTDYNSNSIQELNDIKSASDAKGVCLRTPLRYLSIHKIKTSIKSTKTHKACGPDTIKPIVLRNLPSEALVILQSIYEACIHSKYTPLTWRKANVILIPKPNKPDYQKVGAFRPITLANHLFKTLEKLVLWHITETSLKARPLNDNQHAFRNDSSTESAALQVVTQIEENMYKKKFTVSLFADISGAFDTVTGDAIIQAMRKRQIEESIIDWYDQYIRNRIATISIQNFTKTIKLNRGCPQGGCLSTLAWNLVFDELLDAFKKHGVKIVGFADDACLLVSGDSLGHLFRRMNVAIRTLVQWAGERGLVISKEKTVGMIFTRRHKYQMPSNHLTLDGEKIRLVEEATYLGLTFTSKLRWGKHIKNKINAAKGKIFKYKGFMKANWGPPQKSMRWLYTGVIRPGITYGCLIWGKAVMNQFQDELRRVQGLALMMQGLFRKNTPRRSLEVLSGIEPLHLFIYNQLLKSGYRNLHHINGLLDKSPNISDQSTVKYIIRELQALGIPRDPELLDRIPKTRMFERNFSLIEDSFNTKWPTIHRENINIFTDGSQLGGKCGYGFYVDDQGVDTALSTPMPDYSTVFQCEIFAIQAAAEWLSGTRGREVHFFIDSQAAISALCSDEIRSRSVLDTITYLEIAGEHNIIKLNWIKAHNGHAMNDIADHLAKAGSESFGPHKRIPIPDAFVKELIDKETIKRWNRGWVNVEGHRQTKLFFPEVNTIKAAKLYKAPKALYSQAIRWITGFNGLAYQNNKINPGEFPSPLCQLCEEWHDETSQHLIAACPALFWERMHAFKTTREIDDLESIKIHDLFNFLKNNRVRMMENIAEYPLLFIEDYNQIHDILDSSANHETSLLSRNNDTDTDNEDGRQPPLSQEDDLGLPPAKRRDRRPSNREGIG